MAEKVMCLLVDQQHTVNAFSLICLVFSTFKWIYNLLSTDRQLSEKDILKTYIDVILT
jgi:hypothetical protein